MASQHLQQQLPPRSIQQQTFHLNLSSSNHMPPPPPPHNITDFTKERTTDEPNCTSVTSIASTNSSARTSVIDFRKKQSFQLMDASIRANTPLSSRTTAPAIESAQNLEEKTSLQISKPIHISSTTKSSKASSNLCSPNSIDCFDFIAKTQQQQIQQNTETSNSISITSSLTPRNQSYLQSFNMPIPPKIHLKLPSLIKQSQEPLQTLISTSKAAQQKCSQSPNALLQVKKSTGISIRRDMLIPKNLPNKGTIIKPTLTPRQSTTTTPIIENPVLLLNQQHQRQLSQISPSTITTTTNCEHTCFFDDQQKQRVLFSNQRIVLFASLKFQQIDYLRSNFISKEEIFDFFEGSRRSQQQSSKSTELSGFKEEEEHLKSNLSFFLKNTHLATTERSGLLNFREFKNLLKAFFQTIVISQKSSPRTFSNQNNIYIPSSDHRQHHSLSKESKNKITMPIQQRIVRRELKSAHIYRDKLSIDEGDVKKQQQQQQQFNSNQNNQFQEIVKQADQNRAQSGNNKQNNNQQYHCSQTRQQTPQKPRVVVAIPRLRSFSIQPEIKMKSDSDCLSKNVFGLSESTRDDDSKIVNEGYPSKTAQSQSQQQESAESFSGASLFECTFQPYHFNQILSQQQAVVQDSSQMSHSFQKNQQNREDECTVNSCQTSFAQSIAISALQDAVEEAENNTIICRSSRQFNQDSRAIARSHSKYNSSIGITPMPRAVLGNNNNITSSSNGIDQNCFNFLLKKEVKVLKKSSLKKQPSFNEDSLNSPIDRDILQGFDASTRTGISKKLFSNFPDNQIESQQANNVSTTQGYDIQFIV